METTMTLTIEEYFDIMNDFRAIRDTEREDSSSNFRRIESILQAAKDRPQPEPVAWMKRDTTSDMLPESAIDMAMQPDAAAYIRKTWMPLYTHPPQPAVDRLIEAGDSMYGAAEYNRIERDGRTTLAHACEAWRIAKSVAPVAPAKPDVDAIMAVLADCVIGNSIGDIQYIAYNEVRARLTELLNR